MTRKSNVRAMNTTQGCELITTTSTFVGCTTLATNSSETMACSDALNAPESRQELESAPAGHRIEPQ